MDQKKKWGSKVRTTALMEVATAGKVSSPRQLQQGRTTRECTGD